MRTRPPLAFTAGERSLLTQMANRLRWKIIVGGRLSITNHRLIFEPNVFDRLIQPTSLSVDLHDVVGVHAGQSGLRGLTKWGLGASWYTPVVISTSTSSYIFTVGKGEKVSEVLRVLSSVQP